MGITIYRTEPLATCGKGLASVKKARAMSPMQRLLRRCCHCKRLYVNAGYAQRCEHWHERPPNE
jgi:hypothetical protein